MSEPKKTPTRKKAEDDVRPSESASPTIAHREVPVRRTDVGSLVPVRGADADDATDYVEYQQVIQTLNRIWGIAADQDIARILGEINFALGAPSSSVVGRGEGQESLEALVCVKCGRDWHFPGPCLCGNQVEDKAEDWWNKGVVVTRRDLHQAIRGRRSTPALERLRAAIVEPAQSESDGLPDEVLNRAVEAVMDKHYPGDPESEDSWRITRAELETAAPVFVEAANKSERERIKEAEQTGVSTVATAAVWHSPVRDGDVTGLREALVEELTEVSLALMLGPKASRANREARSSNWVEASNDIRAVLAEFGVLRDGEVTVPRATLEAALDLAALGPKAVRDQAEARDRLRSVLAQEGGDDE